MVNVSVVVPAKNEESFLPDLLDSLIPQLDDGDEVIVVDDYSTDNTVAVAKSYGCTVVTARKNVRIDFNTGVVAASNPTILVVGADCIIPSGHVEKVKEYFEKSPELVALSGPMCDRENTIVGGVVADVANRLWKGVGWMAYRRDAFFEVGGYPNRLPHMGKDVAFWNKLEEIGYTLYDPGLLVLTDLSTWKSQTLPILGSSGVATGLGLVLRRKNKVVGNFVSAAGVGVGLSQAAWDVSGHRSIGIIRCENEECVVERHIHHSGIGAIIMLASLFLEALPIEREVKDEAVAGTAGLGFGMMLHGLVTAPR